MRMKTQAWLRVGCRASFAQDDLAEQGMQQHVLSTQAQLSQQQQLQSTVVQQQVAASRAAATLPEFTAQALTNLFWGFAAIGHDPGTQCLAALVQEVSRRMPELSTQQLGLIIWSFGKLRLHPGVPLLEACAAYVRQRMLQFAPNHLANVCWGWALLDLYPGGDDMDWISSCWHQA